MFLLSFAMFNSITKTAAASASWSHAQSVKGGLCPELATCHLKKKKSFFQKCQQYLQKDMMPGGGNKCGHEHKSGEEEGME